MPYLSFGINFVWVMIIGLFGPSIPAIIIDLNISYTQAGLFFTLFSLGSMLGASLGGIAADYFNKKLLLCSTVFIIAAGLICVGLAPSYTMILVCIFLLSLGGSPASAIGQSIMLGMFPEAREHNLSIQTLFASMGSFFAPIIVAINFSLLLSWRWAFFETAGLALLLFLAVMLVPLPRIKPDVTGHKSFFHILKNPGVLISAVLIFFYIAPDLGFSYWLAEYFRTELKQGIALASSVVSIYLSGVILGRLITSRLVKRIKPVRILVSGPVLSLASLVIFLCVPLIPVKVVCVFFYGLGLSPIFPLLMARGTAVFPKQPGSATGVLYAFVSLGGMVFPLVLGSIASRIGIERSYILLGLVLLGIIISVILWEKAKIKSRI